MNKISFIIEFDEISKTQEGQLAEFLTKTGIKFHVLESDNDLKKYKKYKEVIDKAIKYIRNHQLVFKNATLEEIEEWFNQFYINVLDILNNEIIDKINNLKIHYEIKPSFTTRKLKQLQKENNQLKTNWNKLKEYLNYQSERAVGEDEYVYDEIYNKMQEIIGESNEESNNISS